MNMQEMLEDRKVQHGDFNDHARIAQELKDVMRKELGWSVLTSTQKEGLEMIQHKIARILAGNPDHADHWQDVEGYARITRERLPQRDVPARPPAPASEYGKPTGFGFKKPVVDTKISNIGEEK